MEGKLDESSLVQLASAELSAEDQELLKVYHHSFDDEKVDLDLIMHLLFNICQSSDEGERVFLSVLSVFTFNSFIFSVKLLKFERMQKNALGAGVTL